MAIYANENGTLKNLTEKTDYSNGFVINGIKYIGTRTSDDPVRIPNYTNYRYIVLIPLHVKTETTVRVPVIIKVEDMGFTDNNGVEVTTRNIGWDYSVNAGRGGAYITLKKDENNATTLVVYGGSPKYGVFVVY